MPVAATAGISRAFEFSSLAGNNAVGPAGTALFAQVNDSLGNAVRNSVFWTATILLARAQTQLAALSKLKSNWDSYGAPVPNQVALENGARLLEHMTPIELSVLKIVPSAEGGVGFCFATGNRYADIESSNDGDILGVKYVGTEPPVLIETDGSDSSIKCGFGRGEDPYQCLIVLTACAGTVGQTIKPLRQPKNCSADTHAHTTINGQFSNTGISFDSAPSVNREKYCQPQDVIFDEAEQFADWGVLSFRVSDLPTAFPFDDPKYRFSPKHVPMEDNYSHSEVWCDVLPATGMYVKPSKQVRKLFRALLSQRCVVEIIATV